jgi:hypothetical protein
MVAFHKILTLKHDIENTLGRIEAIAEAGAEEEEEEEEGGEGKIVGRSTVH